MILPLDESSRKRMLFLPESLQHWPLWLLHPGNIPWLGIWFLGKKVKTKAKPKQPQHSDLLKTGGKQSRIRHSSPNEIIKYQWFSSAKSPSRSLPLATIEENCGLVHVERKAAHASETAAFSSLPEGPEWRFPTEDVGCITCTEEEYGDDLIMVIQYVHGEEICKQNAPKLKWKRSNKSQWMQT